MTAPARPESVPENAVFNSESALWELSARDERGRLHGEFALFGADGGLITRGAYVEGELDGEVLRFSDGAPGSQVLRACCVPPGARALKTRYRAGRLLDEIFYDERGQPLSEDGTPWPERRGNVPADARYEETSSRYVSRIEHADGSETLRYYSPEGALEDELDVAERQPQALRRFAPDGSLREETPIDDHGRRHGKYRAHFAENASDYANARIVEVQGEHEHGEAVGSWELRDAAGGLVKRVEYGAVLRADALSFVAGVEPDGVVRGEALWELAETTGRAPREAVALAARALGIDRDVARFERFLAAHTAPLRPDLAGPRGDEVASSQGLTASALLGALLAGVAPAVILRTLAPLLTGNAPAALAYFDASLLLAPTQAMAPMARALLCIEHGEPEGALAAAALVATESEKAATSLREFRRVTYEAFPFRPAVDGIASPSEPLVEIEAMQPLAAVEDTLELYATRILIVRRELERRAHRTPAWLPPDTSPLLRRGPRELRRYTARIEDEGENGPQIAEVEVDETLTLGVSTRRLLSTARSDWAALGWLCWASGLDSIARPDRLVPRADFAAAAHQATVRCWRAHDRRRMSGLVALARNVESFEWEGMPIDAVPAHLIEVTTAEYLEVRAVFFWLMFPQNESPFQSDLRRV
jgi:hypothetical protein